MRSGSGRGGLGFGLVVGVGALVGALAAVGSRAAQATPDGGAAADAQAPAQASAPASAKAGPAASTKVSPKAGASVSAAKAGAGAAKAGASVSAPKAGASGALAAPSPLIFPVQSIPLRFDHARHLKMGPRCETCHISASSSTSVGDNLIPPEAACRGCHKIDRAQPTKAVAPGQPAARCDACHVSDAGPGGAGNGGGAGHLGAPAGVVVGWMPSKLVPEPPRVWLSRPNLKFNHQLHVARGVGCELCHANVALGGLATRADLPTMPQCLACHDGKQATARCAACHLTEPDGRLRTSLASAATAAVGGTGKLVPSGVLRGLDAHGPTFSRDHAQAGRDEGYCLSCHRRSECLDCHGGAVRPFDIHPSDYVSLHGVDARRNTPDCSSCHRNQSFCVGCHQRTGVAADPTGGLPGRPASNPFGTGTQLKQFHPPGWVHDEGAGPSGHSQQAKRNLRSCVSCHREESCLACHSADPARGGGVSPHGPVFGGTARCKALADRNRRACLKCHALGAPELDCELP
jgi:hypothetical protein